MNLDAQRVSQMLTVEIESYLWELWDGNEVARRHYLENLKHYSFVFKNLRIDAKILYDDDPNVSFELPYGFSIEGKETLIFDSCRERYEQARKKKGE